MALFSKEQTPAQTQGRPASAFPANGSFVGPALIIDGTISGTEAVFIEGTVKGRIDMAAAVHLGKQARVTATVHGKSVVVEGTLTGDITADDRVELVATATVDGNIKAPKIVVAEGAKFRGTVDMGSPRPKDHPPAEGSSHKK